MTIMTKICGVSVGGNCPPRVMGILNLSPESFYKNSIQTSSSVLEAAQKMIDEGADFLDVGARSTAPGSEFISVEEEKTRLFSALKELSGNVSVPISVDTMFSEVAKGALKCGADIINDISGLKRDPKMAPLIADHGAAAILMATKNKPGDPLGMDAVLEALSDSVSLAKNAGIGPKKLILDPAIGHWIPEKTPEYDFDVIHQFGRLLVFEMPILVAVSRKSFLGSINETVEDRLFSGMIAASIAAYNGGHIIRTHDVSNTVDAVKVIHAISKAKMI